MVFLVTDRDGKAIWHRSLALSPGWYVLGLGVALTAGIMYWSHRRQPRLGDPIRPFESLPSLFLIAMPRPVAVLITRIMFIPTLYWNRFWRSIFPRKQRWWDRIDDRVILGALPSQTHVADLYREGVRAIVNTCDEYDGPLEEYRTYGIEQLHIPTIDYTPPTMEDIERAIDFMRRHSENGSTIYVHCKAGRGRSATVVICYLIRYAGLTAAQAQHFMQQKRGHISRFLYCRPVVLEYEKRYLTHNSSNGSA